MPARHRLTALIDRRVEDLFLLGFSVEEVRLELNKRVSKTQLYRMRSKLENFGCVRPPAVCKLGRPMVFQNDMREAVVEFLIEYDKLATIDEIQAMIEEEFDVFPSWETVRTEVHKAGLTKKVVSNCAGSLGLQLTGYLID